LKEIHSSQSFFAETKHTKLKLCIPKNLQAHGTILMVLIFYSENDQEQERLPLVRELRGSNPEPIKSLTRCQRLATAAALKCGPLRKDAELGTAHS